MCFSESVSWLAFGTGMAGCTALSRGTPEQHALSIYFVFVVIMQLYEALLWRQRGECTQANTVVTKLAAVTNHLQPVALFVSSWLLLTPATTSKPLLWSTVVAVLVYAAVFAHITTAFVQRAECTRIKEGSLVWEWNLTNPQAYALYLATTAMVLLTFYKRPQSLLGIILCSWLVSFLMYRDTKLVGSMWCFFGAMVPWILLALPATS